MISTTIIITIKIKLLRNRVSDCLENDTLLGLFNSLIANDIFFIIFRIPLLYFLLSNNNGLNVYSFNYDIFAAVSNISHVFYFLIFILFNKAYKNLFFKYIKCKFNE